MHIATAEVVSTVETTFWLINAYMFVRSMVESVNIAPRSTIDVLPYQID